MSGTGFWPAWGGAILLAALLPAAVAPALAAGPPAAIPAAVAPPTAPPPLSDSAKKFYAMVGIAVSGHPGVAATGVARAERQDETDIAFAGLLPQVQGGFTGGYNHFNPPSAVGLPSRRIDVQLSVTQIVYDFGATFDRLGAAKANQVAAGLQFKAASNTYALKAIEAYFDVLRFREMVGVTQDYIKRLTGLVGDVSQRAESGVGSSLDSLRAQAMMAEANSRLADAMARETRAEAAFREVFGEPPGALAAPELDFGWLDGATEAQEVAAAKSRNPALLAQKALLDGTTLEAQAAQADLLPKVEFRAGGTKYDATFAGHNDPLNYEMSAGFNVIYKLYSGGADQAHAHAANSKRDQSRYDFDRASGELDRDTRLAVADLVGNRRRIAARDLARQSEEAALAARLEQFKAGRAQFMDILSGQQAVFGAQADTIQARYDLLLAHFDLMELTGELIDLLGLKE